MLPNFLSDQSLHSIPIESTVGLYTFRDWHLTNSGSRLFHLWTTQNIQTWGFPGSSAGKESACNARDPVSTPGSESSPGEGIGYPLQYFWAFPVTQMVKNPPAMWETWIPFLGWEDPLEEGMATHSSFLAWKTPWSEKPGRPQSMGSQRVEHD